MDIFLRLALRMRTREAAARVAGLKIERAASEERGMGIGVASRRVPCLREVSDSLFRTNRRELGFPLNVLLVDHHLEVHIQTLSDIIRDGHGGMLNKVIGAMIYSQHRHCRK